MHSLDAERTPAKSPNGGEPAVLTLAPTPSARAEPARVIEVGEITAGIAVPEGRGVRFFSSARAFDGLDGATFRTAEQAARAARQRVTARPHAGSRLDPARLRRA